MTGHGPTIGPVTAAPGSPAALAAGTPALSAQAVTHGMQALSLQAVSYLVTDACTACGACLLTCPEHAFQVGLPLQVRADRCTDCGECIEICPADAIERVLADVIKRRPAGAIERRPADAIEPVFAPRSRRCDHDQRDDHGHNALIAGASSGSLLSGGAGSSGAGIARASRGTLISSGASGSGVRA